MNLFLNFVFFSRHNLVVDYLDTEIFNMIRIAISPDLEFYNKVLFLLLQIKLTDL